MHGKKIQLDAELSMFDAFSISNEILGIRKWNFLLNHI